LKRGSLLIPAGACIWMHCVHFAGLPRRCLCLTHRHPGPDSGDTWGSARRKLPAVHIAFGSKGWGEESGIRDQRWPLVSRGGRAAP
jgi:hypothetical protein